MIANMVVSATAIGNTLVTTFVKFDKILLYTRINNFRKSLTL